MGVAIILINNIYKFYSYKNDLETIEAYKQLYEKIKSLNLFSDKQKEQPKREVQDPINILLRDLALSN